VLFYMDEGTSRAVTDKGGCSACPSPSGNMISNNLYLSPREHQQFRVLNRQGQELKFFKLQEDVGLPWDYYANILTWSGNGEEWMVLPIGQASYTPKQLTKNTSPCIFNVNTKEKHVLIYRENDHWQPHDYYSGKVVGSTTPALQLSETSLAFSADSGGTSPVAQTVDAFTANGELEGLAITGAPDWLTAEPEAASGSSITISNQADIDGLAPGDYDGTVTVSTDNAGSAEYQVSLTVREADLTPVLTSVTVTPPDLTLDRGSSFTFLALARDQFGRRVADATVTWSAGGGGTIDDEGTFTAGTQCGGSHEIVAAARSGGTTVRDTALVVISTQGPWQMKVNAGSNANDVDGWERDDDYVSGGEDLDMDGGSVTDGVPGAAPAGVYRSVRHVSPHGYTFTGLAPGNYTVRMHFTDEADPAQRRMSYTVNDVNVLRDFDPAAWAGSGEKALVLDFVTLVRDNGELNIDCSAPSGDVFEAGLELIQSRRAALTLIFPNGGDMVGTGGPSVIRWSADDRQVTNVMIHLSVDGGLSWVAVTDRYGIESTDENWGAFEWQAPDSIETEDGTVSTESDECLIRISDYTAPGMFTSSDGPFSIVHGAAINGHDALSRVREGITVRAGGKFLSIAIPSFGAYRVQLMALDGAVVAQTAGNGRLDWQCPLARVSAGLYLLRVESQGRAVKMMLPVVR
jgi:hypothetical protein